MQSTFYRALGLEVYINGLNKEALWDIMHPLTSHSTPCESEQQLIHGDHNVTLWDIMHPLTSHPTPYESEQQLIHGDHNVTLCDIMHPPTSHSTPCKSEQPLLHNVTFNRVSSQALCCDTGCDVFINNYSALQIVCDTYLPINCYFPTL